MTGQEVKLAQYEEILNGLGEEGLEGFGKAMQSLLNEAMRIERSKYLGAGPYERTENRVDYANGYKPKTLKTRIGNLELSVPQVREGNFYPSALERGQRSERALLCSLAEMYVKGVSTRKVSKITEQLCGFEVTSSQVSRAASRLDEELTKWRNRPLGEVPYVQLDARYEKIRHGGCLISCAVLIARGITKGGKRSILGVSVSLSEAEVHWRQFLESLQKRGLRGMRLITSDDHPGLKAARQSVFPGTPWQRCQFHLQRNARSYVGSKSMQAEIASSIRGIFGAPSREEAERLLRKTIEKFEKKYPELTNWMSENIPEGLAVYEVPEAHRRKLRTSNGLERVNREIKRRTQVAGLFPNTDSCLRLVSAILMEISEDWEISDAKYMKFEN